MSNYAKIVFLRKDAETFPPNLTEELDLFCGRFEDGKTPGTVEYESDDTPTFFAGVRELCHLNNVPYDLYGDMDDGVETFVEQYRPGLPRHEDRQVDLGDFLPIYKESDIQEILCVDGSFPFVFRPEALEVVIARLQKALASDFLENTESMQRNLERLKNNAKAIAQFDQKRKERQGYPPLGKEK